MVKYVLKYISIHECLISQVEGIYNISVSAQYSIKEPYWRYYLLIDKP